MKYALFSLAAVCVLMWLYELRDLSPTNRRSEIRKGLHYLFIAILLGIIGVAI